MDGWWEGRKEEGRHEWVSPLSQTQQTRGSCGSREQETSLLKAAAPGSPPPGCSPRGGRWRRGWGPRPASCRPAGAAAPDKARRFHWPKRASRLPARVRTANWRIEMQISGYKRGGAAASRKTRGIERDRGTPPVLRGARGLAALAALLAVRAWLRPWFPAGTVRAARTRTAGRPAGTARCGWGPRAEGRVGGLAGLGFSDPLPAGPEASGGEEAACADQREPAGVAAVAGWRRGAAARRAPVAAGRAGWVPERAARLTALPARAGAS